jgi:hypothetical protein
MTARTQSRSVRRGLLALLAAGAFLCDFNDVASFSVQSAEAQYGTSRRVARRTARRTSRRYGAAYAGGGGGYATAPPSNCMHTGAIWECQGQQYEQAMEGDQVVYVKVVE